MGNSFPQNNPAARLPVSANESYEVKNDGFKPSLRHPAIYRGLRPLLKPPSGLESKGITPSFFIRVGVAIALWHKAGLSYFKCLSLMKNLKATPKIYVGTYGKYNDGSLEGRWFDLESFENAESFVEACKAFHSDELEAEFMFQDWENMPSFLISEYFLHPDAFLYFQNIAEMDQTTAEAFRVYCENITSWPEYGNDFEAVLEEFNESYQGYYGGAMNDPKTEFAYQYIENIGLLEGVPQMLERYFDYEAFGRDMFLGDYTEYEGYIFLNM